VVEKKKRGIGRVREVEEESNRRKMTTITMMTKRKWVRADLVWQSTTTWHSPVTGVSWWRVARTNTAVLPMPFYHITLHTFKDKERKERRLM
jgi:hypothetical protein